MNNEIVIDGQTYVKKSANGGNRHVVILDRGWIYAGDLEEKDGRIFLANVIWVFSWSSCGLDAVIENPSKGNLRKFNDFNFPEDVEIFRIPVHDTWGLGS